MEIGSSFIVSALLSTHFDNSITSQSFDSWTSNQKCALLTLGSVEALGMYQCFRNRTVYKIPVYFTAQGEGHPTCGSAAPTLEAGTSLLVPKHLLLTSAICSRKGPATLPWASLRLLTPSAS